MDRRGRATELISLYIPPTRQIPDVSSYLRNEYSQSSNIKSKSTRKNVMAAIESILSRLKGFRMPPENGLAFFVGHVAKGANQTEMTQVVIEPPMPLTTFMYRCDSTFYIEPLEEMLADTETYGLLVVDRGEATIGILRGKRIDVIKNIPSRVPSKHGQGGQSQRRFERLIEIAAHDFFKNVGEVCTEAWLGEEGLKGILVGGPGATKDFFVDQEFLHHELKKKIVETFDTGYTNEYGLSELVQNASDTLSDLGIMKEKKVMQRFMDEVRKEDGGASAYGEGQVRYALQMGAVDTLLISEDLRWLRVKERCNQCKEERDRTIKKKEETDLPCEKCGGAVSIEEREDIVEELATAAEETSTRVEFISTDSAEGDMLMRAFGGLAAILRYRLAQPK